MNLVLKALTLATETIKLLVALKEIGLEKNRQNGNGMRSLKFFQSLL
jgi:hypothetical protein